MTTVETPTSEPGGNALHLAERDECAMSRRQMQSRSTPHPAEQIADDRSRASRWQGQNGDEVKALECRTARYYEAGRESERPRAVAQVILNRVRHPAYPASVCGVVFEGSTRATGCQFTFTCDGSMARAPMTSEWARARKAAWAALNGAVHAPAGLATHYHANYVVPYWASSLVKTHVEGPHIFYRCRVVGQTGLSTSATPRARPMPARCATALSVEHVLPEVWSRQRSRDRTALGE